MRHSAEDRVIPDRAGRARELLHALEGEMLTLDAELGLQALFEISDQIPAVFDPDRETDQPR